MPVCIPGVPKRMGEVVGIRLPDRRMPITNCVTNFRHIWLYKALQDHYISRLHQVSGDHDMCEVNGHGMGPRILLGSSCEEIASLILGIADWASSFLDRSSCSKIFSSKLFDRILPVYFDQGSSLEKSMKIEEAKKLLADMTYKSLCSTGMPTTSGLGSSSSADMALLTVSKINPGFTKFKLIYGKLHLHNPWSGTTYTDGPGMSGSGMNGTNLGESLACMYTYWFEDGEGGHLECNFAGELIEDGFIQRLSQILDHVKLLTTQQQTPSLKRHWSGGGSHYPSTHHTSKSTHYQGGGPHTHPSGGYNGSANWHHNNFYYDAAISTQKMKHHKLA